MTDQTTDARGGMGYALLSAATAGLCLFTPVLLIGYSLTLVMTVVRGDGVAWASSAGMSYAFGGILALLGIVLLTLPYRWFRSASRRLGTQQAIRWVGGLLAAGHAGVALIWAQQAVAGSRPVLETDETWYAIAFGIAAVVIVLATVIAAKRAVVAAVALATVLTAGIVALIVVLVSVWGSPIRIPSDAQVVHVVLADGEVRLEPATVHAGDVYFLVEGPDAAADRAGFSFIIGGYGANCCDRPLPLNDDTAAGLVDGDYLGTGSEGGWYGDSPVKYQLVDGKYAFITGGGPPGVRPDSVAILEVRSAPVD